MRNLTLRDPAFVGGSLLSVINTPLFNFPFSGNRTLTDTVSGGSLITFSRAAATGTFFDSSGILQTAAANAARFTTDPLTLVSLGLLGEDQRTNSIRNNTMQGAVAGTPGTLPTNWVQSALATGLTANVLGTGTSSGINYIDIRISGTTANANGWSIFTDANTQIAASSGQVWTGSSYVAIISGSLANITAGFVRVVERNSGGGYIAESNILWTAATTVLANNPFSVARTLGGSAAFVQFGVYFQSNSGVAIDITLRIGLPQLEQGASATSVIPASGTAVTRNADVADITNANAALIAAIRTIFVEFRSPAVGTRGVLSLNDGTANNRIDIRTSGTAVQVVIVTGGVTQATLAAGTIAANARARLAVRLGATSFSVSINGAAPVSATGTLPTVDRAAIARTQANEYLNGTIATITAWAQEFTDSMLVSQST